MDENLIIGVQLLDYMSELTDVAASLISAKEKADNALAAFDASVYEGQATDAIVTFLTGYSAQIERLELFYQKAAQYVYNTYDTMYKSDEAMAAWLTKQEGVTFVE